MKNKLRALVALILVLCLTLTGCAGVDFGGYFQNVFSLLLGGWLTPFSEMEYIRPDMEELERIVEECTASVAEAESLYALVSVIYEAYAPLDAFSTAYALANIHYCKDLTDTYWSEEYAFCSENAPVAQAALDKFYRALAASAFREDLETEAYFGPGFFDNYEGESIYDDNFTAMLSQEAELENRYYTLWNEAGDMDPYSEEFYTVYGSQMSALFVELIVLRQDMAAYLGYASYPEFAYEYYYGRDYTCQETTSYLADIRAELVPLYETLYREGVDVQVEGCDGAQTLEYVKTMAYSMGGVVRRAYDDMIGYQLYDIDYSPNKYPASFEVYINGYSSPYLFINPTLSEYDQLTMAHEFGHFCCDYAAGGSGAGVDVAEIFSQGMEYMSLCYVPDTGNLETLKMVDSLSIMVEQSAFAAFEMQVYSLDAQTLTTDAVEALFAQVCGAYGFRVDGRVYTQITHFFTNPMYVFSYVVSNDVAMQLYRMEQTTAGSGRTVMENAFGTAHTGIVAFAAEYGLESPFADGRITAIRETIQQIFQ